MEQDTRLERQLGGWLARATTPRGAAIVIATTTTTITLLAGVLMRFLDEDNYPSIWAGSGGPSRPSRRWGTATAFR